jgi:Flp pilus assembly protein TadG
MLFAMLETSTIFFATFTLENGVTEAAREIRTGQAQADGVDEAAFRDSVCERIDMLLDCGDSLKIDVRTFANFQDVNAPAALDENGEFINNFIFDPGAEGDVVLVRAFYSWPVLTPIIGGGMSNMDGENRLLSAAAAFRNEPFGELVN